MTFRVSPLQFWVPAFAATSGGTECLMLDPITSAFSSTACISTLAPAVAQSGLMSSALVMADAVDARA